MRINRILWLTALCYLAGCSWSQRSADESDNRLVVPYEASVPTTVELYQARLDSVISFLEFGNIGEFETARDSLERDLHAHMTSSYSDSVDIMESGFLQQLARLDSMITVGDYRHVYLSEEDSLALAEMNWPENGRHTTVFMTLSPDTLFPYLDNKRIDFWIRYFTGSGKERFSRALYRMQRHRKTIESILDEMGLPRELICVPLIESGFYLKARSTARAVGPWQFIAGTGRIYGLRIDWWVDERRDIIASTYSAGNYLRDLEAIWDDWFLALAAYNAGEYRIARSIVRYNTHDFWELRLPKQTERYVPKFLATLYILRDPEKYGFTLPEVEPEEYDHVTVKDATDLTLIAKLSDTTPKIIHDLNPALLRWCTPPKMEISVKVPPGKGQLCSQRLADIPPDQRVTWRRHTIKQGETLSQIATKYGTTTTALKRLNKIKNSHKIRAGKTLIVPMKGSYAAVAHSKPSYKNTHRNINREYLEKRAKKTVPSVPRNYNEVIYIVKQHDTLGEIAEVYHTSAKKLRYWNNLSYRSYIHPGQKLRIYVPKSFKVTTTKSTQKAQPSTKNHVKTSYLVKKGDTLYGISKKFDVSMSDLLAWNKKSSKSKIFPGERLEIWQKIN